MKLVAPEGTASSTVDGTVYEPDENGEVEVHSQAHADILTNAFHGYSYPGGVRAQVVNDPVVETTAPALVSDALIDQESSDPADQQDDTGDTSEGENPGEESGEENEGEPPVGVTEEDIRSMNKVDLIDFIEERGGEIEGKPSKDALVEQALGLLNSAED